MIARLPPGTCLKQCARHVDHPTRTRPLVEQGRPACRAKAARGVPSLVFESNNALMAEGDTKAASPDAHIGRIGSTVRKLGRPGVVVPCPECRIVDLQPHPTTGTLGSYRRRRRLSQLPVRYRIHSFPRWSASPHPGKDPGCAAANRHTADCPGAEVFLDGMSPEKGLTHQRPNSVMPTQVGIHDFPLCVRHSRGWRACAPEGLTR